MLYLIFPTEQDAQDRSHEIAVEQGCSGVTQYWFGWIVHPTTLEGALQIPEDQQSVLTEIEIAELKDQAFMEAGGWFEQPAPVEETVDAEAVVVDPEIIPENQA